MRDVVKTIFSKVIILQHWGLYKDHKIQTNGQASHRPGLDIVLPCMTPGLGLRDGLVSQHNSLAPRVNKTLKLFHAGTICRDVEMARQERREVPRGYCYNVLENGTDAQVQRLQWTYSGGVRPHVYRHFRHLPGFKVVKVR
jgi:hypothetical protein